MRIEAIAKTASTSAMMNVVNTAGGCWKKYQRMDTVITLIRNWRGNMIRRSMKQIYHDIEKEDEVTEQSIQNSIIKYLKSMGYFTIKTMAVSPAGIPDVIAIAPEGFHIYFEIKTDTGRLSKVQQAMHTRMRVNGCVIHTVTSLKEVKDILE